MLVAGTIAAATYLKFGTVEALRAVTSMVMPLSLIWFFFLGWAAWYLRQGRIALGLLFLLLWFSITAAFNVHAAQWAIRSIEKEVVEQTDPGPFDAVVVLGGGVGISPSGKPEVNRDGQRVVLAAQLWHAKRTKAIVCTGERAGIGDDQSDIARQILLSLGVPARVIYRIGGENTTQEMQNLKVFLDDPPSELGNASQVGLITSAFHMPRAMRLASTNGLEFAPVPCCFRGSWSYALSPAQLIPNLDAGITFGFAIKEVLAGWVGR